VAETRKCSHTALYNYDDTAFLMLWILAETWSVRHCASLQKNLLGLIHAYRTK